MKLDQEQLAKVRNRMLASFASLGTREFSATAEGVVSVRMNGKLELLEIHIHNFVSQTQTSLQNSLVTGINQTIREIIRDRANELAVTVSQEMNSSDSTSNS